MKKRPARSDDDLNARVAEVIFGWKEVRRVDGRLKGKKPDKLGRLRSATVPDYASDPRHGSMIEERMLQLKKGKEYARRLAKTAAANRLPADWASPELRARTALQVLGRQTVLKTVK
jgi:hypothetical protein